MIKRLVSALILLLCLVSFTSLCSAASLEDSIDRLQNEMREESIENWKYITRDVPGAEKPAYDDSTWQTGSPEFDWGPAPIVWIRNTITIPETAGGMPVAGSKVYLRAGIDDSGECYVNGVMKQAFDWDKCRVLLTENAKPGEKFQIAFKGINGPGGGRLLFAYLDFSFLEEWRSMFRTITNEIAIAKQMIDSEADKDKQKIYRDSLQSAVQAIDIDAINRKDKAAFEKSVASFHSNLGPLEKAIKEFTVHLIGHAHIDMNWLWLWPETIDVCKNTFSTMLKIMDMYPDFKFSQSQASTYVIMEELYPEIFAQIQQKVKEGRWEITGGTWVEGDMNMASGESIVRQIMYARRYFKEKFGVESEICWEPDTFGHAWTIPQILAKSGIKYYYFNRCGKDDRVFWWEGPEGSRVLAYNFGWYSDTINENVRNYPLTINQMYGVKDGMSVYGVGDHGGGPTMNDLNRSVELQKSKVFPNVKFDTAKGFYETLLAKKKDWPVIKDELNFVFQGCYTTHADIKKMNRVSENLLPTAEMFAAIAGEYGYAYPQDNFVKSWRDTCFNQFHDIFDGSAIHGSYEHSQNLFDNLYATGNDTLKASVGTIANNVDTNRKGIPVVVFNPLSWTRTDQVAIDIPSKLAGKNIVVKDSKGRVIPSQIQGSRIAFVTKNVPSMGYKTVYLSGSTQNAPAVKPAGNVIENEFFAVKVDAKSGTISSIYDKKAKREVMKNGDNSSLLQILMEKPHGMSAWDIGPISKTESLNTAVSVEPLYNGVTSSAIRVKHKFNKSSFSQDIILHAGVPRIDIKFNADWQEIGNSKIDAPMLKVAFPVNVTNGKASFEIPFGTIERPMNGSEVPSQKWIDVSGADYGVSILNDCKYGFDVKDNVMRMTLLRASYEPDPTPDIGKHEVTYSIYPHTGDWKKADTVRRGYELNNPLIAVVTGNHGGRLPSEHSFVKVDKANLVITSLKKAEDSSDLILRMYECKGEGGNARITFGLGVNKVNETDLVEKPINALEIPVNGNSMNIPFGKWEIKTYKLSLK
ncbi:MAG: alpha-mannosidase [Armatimonadota bacterium]